MTKLSEIRQMAAKIESVEGVAESLVAADAKVLVLNPSIEIDPEMKERAIAMTSFSSPSALIGKRVGKGRLAVEIKGSGTATTAPEGAKFLRACGVTEDDLKSVAIGAITSGPFVHGETITGAGGGTGWVICNTYTGTAAIYYVVLTGVIGSSELITGSVSGATATTAGAPATIGKVYRPTHVQASIPSITMQDNVDGIKKLLRGARGSVKIPFKSGEAVTMEFNFQGVAGDVTDEALLSGITYESVTPPNFQDGTFKIDNAAQLISSFDFNLDNKLTQRDDPNSVQGVKSYAITGRQTTGSIDPEMQAVAAYDFFGKWLAGTLATLDLSWGSIAGNKFRFFAKAVQYTKVADGTRDGLALANCSCTLRGTKEIGNDEWALLSM